LIGWYRGLQSSIGSIASSNLVYFYWYDFLKKMSIKYLNENRSLTNIQNLIVASVAGVINVLLTNPIWVVNTRIKLWRGPKPLYSSTLDGLIKVGKEEGIEGLWKGLIPSLALVSNPAIQFATYERIKKIYNKIYDGQQPSALGFFYIGAIAKAVATFLTYPIQIIQARQRANKNKTQTDSNSETSMYSIALQIWKEAGLFGFFRGLESKMLQTISAAALMFVIYEKILRFTKLFVELISRRRLTHIK